MSADDYTISPVRANLVGLLLLIPLSACILLPYAAVWGWAKTGSDFIVFYDHLLLFLLLVAAGITAHELIHGLTWMMAGNLSHGAIKYGVNWKALAPYAHCREPVDIYAYRWGAAMPGIVLGIIPFLVGLLAGNGWFALFGYLFTITASGDILILWLIRDIEPGSLVLDHPHEAGCQVIVPGDDPVAI